MNHLTLAIFDEIYTNAVANISADAYEVLDTTKEPRS